MQGHPDLRGRLGGLIARGAAPEKIAQARADLAAATLESDIRRTAPCLPAETRNQLAVLLLAPAGDSDE